MLVEREDELSFLQDRLAEAARGNGNATILTGPVAIGKTAILALFAERAKRSGALVLSATASLSERKLPFGVIEQLCGLRVPSYIAGPVANLRRTGAQLAAIHDPDAHAGPAALLLAPRVAHSLGTALLARGESTPLVVTIDDAHYADAPSLQCLLYLVRRLKSAPVMLVGTGFARAPASRPYLLADMLRQPYCHRLRLAPLSIRGISQLLASYLGIETDAQLASSCHAVSGGNPLLVRALMDDYRAARQRASKQQSPWLLLGEAFRQAVVELLYRDEAPARQVARALAVLGNPTAPVQLDRLLGLEAGLAGEVVSGLNGAGLFLSGHFRHPEMRRAVLDGMTADERAEMHGRVARMLYHDGAPATVVAPHLLLAPNENEPWLSQVLQEAAEDHLHDDQPKYAVECLKRAYHSCPDEGRRAAVKVMLMAAEWRINPATAGRHLTDLTTAPHQPMLRGPYAVAPIDFMLWYGRVAEALDAVARLADVPGAADPDTAAALYSTALWVSYSYPALADRLGQLKRRIQQLPWELASPRLRAVAALTNVLSGGCDEEIVICAEQVLQHCRLDDGTLAPIVTALEMLICADQLNRALQWCLALLGEATARRSPAWQAVFSAIRAEIAVRQGDLTAANTFSGLALSHIGPRSWGVAIGAPLESQLIACTEMGRLDHAAWLTQVPVPEAMFQTPFGLRYLIARGRYYLATDRPHAALGDFEACGELLAGWYTGSSAIAAWRTDAASALIQLGDAKRARELLTAQLQLATGPSRVRGVALRLLAATCELKRRPALLREAADILSERGARLELAWTLADLGRAQRQLKDFQRARTTMAQALNVARECAADTLASRLVPLVGSAEEANPAAPDTAGWLDLLTDAERRVATMAARGCTNREIAKKLYITVSTVEQHLTRVYRKLNVDRRADLPATPVVNGASGWRSSDHILVS